MISDHSKSAQTFLAPRARVIMMAAGTGGHIFPALAVATTLREQGFDIVWLGTPNGMENRLVPNAGFALFPITISGVRGNGIKRLLAAPFKILRAVIACIRLFKTQRIDVVVGFGGYITVPGGLAARLLGLPLIIHEQNAIAGMSNKLLHPLATRVLQAFPDTFRAHPKVATTGNPLREAICHIAPPQDRPVPANNTPLTILVIGGSLGAQVFNETLPPIWHALNRPLHIIHQCGEKHIHLAQQHYDQHLASSTLVNYTVVAFIDDMATAYSSADLVICRAGALTVCEIAMVGVAAIFVPLPSAVDDHQTFNARYLANQKAATLCPQSIFTSDFGTHLTPLLQRDILQIMARKARLLAWPDATHRVCHYITQTLK